MVKAEQIALTAIPANNSLMVFPLDFPENATVKTNSAVTREPRNAPTDTP